MSRINIRNLINRKNWWSDIICCPPCPESTIIPNLHVFIIQSGDSARAKTWSLPSTKHIDAKNTGSVSMMWPYIVLISSYIVSYPTSLSPSGSVLPPDERQSGSRSTQLFLGYSRRSCCPRLGGWRFVKLTLLFTDAGSKTLSSKYSSKILWMI